MVIPLTSAKGELRITLRQVIFLIRQENSVVVWWEWRHLSSAAPFPHCPLKTCPRACTCKFAVCQTSPGAWHPWAVLAESSGSAGYLQNPTSFESPSGNRLMGTGWPVLPFVSRPPYGLLWKSNGAGNRQGAEAAAAFCVGHQLKMQGLSLTTDAWKVTSWREAMAGGYLHRRT